MTRAVYAALRLQTMQVSIVLPVELDFIDLINLKTCSVQGKEMLGKQIKIRTSKPENQLIEDTVSLFIESNLKCAEDPKNIKQHTQKIQRI